MAVTACGGNCATMCGSSRVAPKLGTTNILFGWDAEAAMVIGVCIALIGANAYLLARAALHRFPPVAPRIRLSPVVLRDRWPLWREEALSKVWVIHNYAIMLHEGLRDE
jgi:hypothetical protein